MGSEMEQKKKKGRAWKIVLGCVAFIIVIFLVAPVVVRNVVNEESMHNSTDGSDVGSKIILRGGNGDIDQCYAPFSKYEQNIKNISKSNTVSAQLSNLTDVDVRPLDSIAAHFNDGKVKLALENVVKTNENCLDIYNTIFDTVADADREIQKNSDKLYSDYKIYQEAVLDYVKRVGEENKIVQISNIEEANSYAKLFGEEVVVEKNACRNTDEKFAYSGCWVTDKTGQIFLDSRLPSENKNRE